MTWWPINNPAGIECDECRETTGLSRDDDGNVYCPDHRGLHRD